MRAQAFALVGVYIFLMGGFFGGLLGRRVLGRVGPAHRAARSSCPRGAARRAADHARQPVHEGDISLGVAELLEEQEERRRMAADPEHIPVLQVRNLDVELRPAPGAVRRRPRSAAGRDAGTARHERRREVDAARAISGICHARPRCGADERPHDHARRARSCASRMGMVQVPGGEALFPTMTVRENLDIWVRLIEDPTKRRGRARARLRDVPAGRVTPRSASRARCRAASSRCWRWPRR